MNFNSIRTKARLDHVVSNRDSFVARGFLDSAVAHVTNGSGNPAGCLSQLRSFSQSSALATWFQTANLSAFKNEMYAASKLEYILLEHYSEPLSDGEYELGAERIALEGAFCLLAGHEGLIDRYSRRDKNFSIKRTENVNTGDYWTKQFFLALRQEWHELEGRCLRIIDNPPTNAREKKFMIDHRFYLALARRDAKEMVAVIKELLVPRKISDRKGLENGYTEDLICTPAVLYTKLAWRNGIEIEIDSPYVPAAWLPETTVEYSDPFEFMKKYKI